ncbi:MAG: alanine racemase [Schwartzia sp.]|nr:alanine racemase [Schwartzia sp. (in: firmicutes)]
MASRGVWAEIDLSALRHNISVIKDHIAGGARFCAVVKADAYGHGAVAVAREAVAMGADYLAVAVLSEAAALRRAGFTTPILVLGATQFEEADAVVDLGVTQAVFSVAAARAISEAAARRGVRAKVHLAVDTGMGRIGVRPEGAGETAAAIAALPRIELEGMFSHFALADATDKTFAKEQFARFRAAMEDVKAKGVEIPVCHIANSAAILEMPETHLDMARAGIILYGLAPSEEVGGDAGLLPVMSVKARLTHVKTLRAGETISYGCTFRASKDIRVGTLPLGYADGYTRLYAGKAKVDFRGKLLPIVGRICMDQCMVELTGAKKAAVGDTVTVMGGDALTADALASWLGTINYEVVCLFSPRVPRVYVERRPDIE